MTATDVLEFLDTMERHGIDVWLDGGWAVDANLGKQTRDHGDLDIAVEERHLSVATDALSAQGFEPVPRADSRPWNFVLGDHLGREIDIHVVVLDVDGNGIYGPLDNPEGTYPAEALTSIGHVGGRSVRCISPRWLVAFHTGYDVDDKDWADVRALCEAFDVPVPDDYARFQ